MAPCRAIALRSPGFIWLASTPRQDRSTAPCSAERKPRMRSWKTARPSPTRRRPVQVPPRRRLRMRVHQDLPPRLLPLRPEHSRLPLQNLALQLRLLRRGLLRRQNRHLLQPPHQTPLRQTHRPRRMPVSPRLQPLQHRQVASHFPIQPRGITSTFIRRAASRPIQTCPLIVFFMRNSASVANVPPTPSSSLVVTRRRKAGRSFQLTTRNVSSPI